MQLAIMHAAGDGFWAYMPTKYFLSYLESNSGDFPLSFLEIFRATPEAKILFLKKAATKKFRHRVVLYKINIVCSEPTIERHHSF